MSRTLKIAIGILTAMVIVGAVVLPSLRRAVQRLNGTTNTTEEQARRAILKAPILTSSDANITAQIYWLAAGSSTSLAPTAVELPLSAEPVERSKQLLQALIEKAPSADQRTLPPDATLLAFYLDPEGIAVADFSDELAQKMPSGILSEQLAVDSITQTLGANVEAIQKLKIQVHGEDMDTLAGHIDLSALFPVPHVTPGAAPLSGSAPTSAPSAPQGAAASPERATPATPPSAPAAKPPDVPATPKPGVPGNSTH